MNRFASDLNSFTSDLNRRRAKLNSRPQKGSQFNLDMNRFTSNLNVFTPDLNCCRSNPSGLGSARGRSPSGPRRAGLRGRRPPPERPSPTP